MKCFLKPIGLGIAIFLQGCVASGPTWNDLKSMPIVEVTTDGLDVCSERYGNDSQEWTQCKDSGIWIDPNENQIRYSGTWLNGRPHGVGIMESPVAGRYEGNIANGLWDGNGILESKETGHSYSGKYKLGQMVSGKITYKNDMGTFVGDFKDWKREGPGERLFPDGIVVQGTWRQNRLVDEAVIKFPDGKVWMGPAKKVFDSGSEIAGKIALPTGEAVQGKLKVKKIAGCGDIKDCKSPWDFRLTFDGPVGCTRFPVVAPSYSSKGLPKQVGPFSLGMTFENFECVISSKFKDISSENALTQGMLLELGTPVTVNLSLSGKRIRYAKAGFYTTTEEVSNLFSIPAWMRKPGKSGKSFGGQIQALFVGDQLASITLGQPAVPLNYLLDRYGNQSATKRTVNEECILGNRVVSRKTHRVATTTWKDPEILMSLELGFGLEGGDLADDSHIFGKGKLPPCAAKVREKNIYRLIDRDLAAEVAVAQEEFDRKQETENRELYKAF